MGLIGQNFTKWKGDDMLIVFTIEDVQSLTGYTAQWQLSVNTSSAVLLSKTSISNGGITFEGNKVIVSVTSTETNDDVTSIPEGQYYHELQLYDPNDKQTVAATGIVTLLNPLYRRT